jgi:hypothetical protein
MSLVGFVLIFTHYLVLFLFFGVFDKFYEFRDGITSANERSKLVLISHFCHASEDVNCGTAWVGVDAGGQLESLEGDGFRGHPFGNFNLIQCNDIGHGNGCRELKDIQRLQYKILKIHSWFTYPRELCRLK